MAKNTVEKKKESKGKIILYPSSRTNKIANPPKAETETKPKK